MTIGSASNSPADCSIETETVGGGGTAPSWMRQPTQHDFPEVAVIVARRRVAKLRPLTNDAG